MAKDTQEVSKVFFKGLASSTLFISFSTFCAISGDFALAQQHDGTLTITGLDTMKFPDGKIELDLEDLQALGSYEIETGTPWTDSVNVFEGVRLDVLLSHLDITHGSLIARALNDYSVEIPVSDAVPGGPIVAYAIDGEAMNTRSRGPFWIVYPYDSHPRYQSELFYTRSIWHLFSIEVHP